MNMEDEDEDVIFKNSPLYRHLTDVGIPESDLEPAESDHIHHAPVDSHRPLNAVCIDDKCGAKKKLLKHILVFTGFQICWDTAALIKYRYTKKILNLVHQSHLLEESDAQIVEQSMEMYNKDCASVPERSMRYKMLLFVTMPCLLAYFYSRLYGLEMSWQYISITDLLAISTVAYLTFAGIGHLLLHYVERKWKHALEHVEIFISQARDVANCMKKSLRLIQETELVARGFTLVSQQQSVWRLEESSGHRLCPTLRKTLFNVSRDIMLSTRNSTIAVLNWPAMQAVDALLVHYMAQLPLEEYGPCIVLTNPAELENLTDGFSVAALKGIVQLCNLHLSEYAVCLLQFVHSIPQYPKSEGSPWSLSNLTDKLEVKNKNLRKCYEQHKCCVIDKKSKVPRFTEPESDTPVRDVYLAVHSLDLHLQSALTRVQQLTTSLEQNIESNTKSVTTREEWGGLLESVRSELKACGSCLEEGSSRLKKMEQKEDVALSFYQPESHELSKKEYIPKIDTGEPVIEDQVFEAYTDPDEMECENCSWDMPLTAEDKEKRKKEKQEALRLLTELKSVISIRAVEREKREQKALLKSRLQKNSDNLLNSSGRKTDPLSEDNFIQDDVSQLQTLSENCQHFLKESDTKKDHIGQQVQISHTLCTNHCADVTCDEEKDNSDSPLDTEKGDVIQCKNNSFRNTGDSAVSHCCCPVQSDIVENKRPTYETNDKGNARTGMFDPYHKAWDKTEAKSIYKTCVNDRIEIMAGTNLSFTANIAAMAAAKSQTLGLSEQTFGDSDDDDDEYNTDNSNT